MATNSNDPQTSTYQALAEFRYQIRRFVRFSEDVARQAGLEPQHHQLLLAVKGVPAGQEPRIAFIAERMQLRHHSAVELVDRLARKGLIRRMRSAHDLREVLLAVTPRGERVLRELTMHTRAELRSAAPGLVAALRKVMSRNEHDRARGVPRRGRGKRRQTARWNFHETPERPGRP